MIDITNIERDAPNAIDKARRERPFVTKIGDGEYKVVPRSYPKQKRRVVFKLEDGHLLADCSDYHTREGCPAVEYGKICYHVAAGLLRLMSYLKQRETAPMKRAA